MAATKKMGVMLATTLANAVAAGAALAHDDPMPKNASPATKAAYARHEHFELMGKTFKTLGDELKKDSPDRSILASSAKTVDGLASQLPTWFPRGTGVEARPMSQANPDIWTDASGFSAAAANLQVQASKLNQAALSGDIGAVRAQFRATGGACKNCHDKFRQEKKS